MLSAVLTLVLVIGGGLAFAGLIVAAASRQSKRLYDAGCELAQRLGLQVAPVQPPPRFFWPAPRGRGRLRERRAELFSFTTGSGKSRTHWCALAVWPRATGGLVFRLSRQGLGTRISQLFGAREIAVGDPEFDRAWFIETNQPEFLTAALLPEIRERLTAALRAGGGRGGAGSFKLEQDMVVYMEVGQFSDAALRERIARVADVLGDLADIAEVFAPR